MKKSFKIVVSLESYLSIGEHSSGVNLSKSFQADELFIESMMNLKELFPFFQNFTFSVFQMLFDKVEKHQSNKI